MDLLEKGKNVMSCLKFDFDVNWRDFAMTLTWIDTILQWLWRELTQFCNDWRELTRFCNDFDVNWHDFAMTLTWINTILQWLWCELTQFYNKLWFQRSLFWIHKMKYEKYFFHMIHKWIQFFTYLVILFRLASFLQNSSSWELRYFALLLAPSDAKGLPNDDLRFPFLGIMNLVWKGRSYYGESHRITDNSSTLFHTFILKLYTKALY